MNQAFKNQNGNNSIQNLNQSLFTYNFGLYSKSGHTHSTLKSSGANQYQFDQNKSQIQMISSSTKNLNIQSKNSGLISGENLKYIKKQDNKYKFSDFKQRQDIKMFAGNNQQSKLIYSYGIDRFKIPSRLYQSTALAGQETQKPNYIDPKPIQVQSEDSTQFVIKHNQNEQVNDLEWLSKIKLKEEILYLQMDSFRTDSWLLENENEFLLEKQEKEFKYQMMFDELKQSLNVRAYASQKEIESLLDNPKVLELLNNDLIQLIKDTNNLLEENFFFDPVYKVKSYHMKKEIFTTPYQILQMNQEIKQFINQALNQELNAEKTEQFKNSMLQYHIKHTILLEEQYAKFPWNEGNENQLYTRFKNYYESHPSKFQESFDKSLEIAKAYNKKIQFINSENLTRYQSYLNLNIEDFCFENQSQLKFQQNNFYECYNQNYLKLNDQSIDKLFKKTLDTFNQNILLTARQKTQLNSDVHFKFLQLYNQKQLLYPKEHIDFLFKDTLLNQWVLYSEEIIQQQAQMPWNVSENNQILNVLENIRNFKQSSTQKETCDQRLQEIQSFYEEAQQISQNNFKKWNENNQQASDINQECVKFKQEQVKMLAEKIISSLDELIGYKHPWNQPREKLVQFLFFQVSLESINFNDSSYSNLIEKELYLKNIEQALRILDQQNQISRETQKIQKKLKDDFGNTSIPQELLFYGIGFSNQLEIAEGTEPSQMFQELQKSYFQVTKYQIEKALSV